MSKYQNNSAITDPDIRDSGIDERSNATLKGSSGQPATAEELALALESMQRRNAELEKQLASQNSGSDAIQQLAAILTQAVKPAVQAVPESDNLNRSTDFRNQRATLDGQIMAESQQLLARFRNEPKFPISIPKAMSNTVGSSLDITVNGVRVGIPCDGKTYYINRTHYEHARERLAKLDLLASNTEPQIVEIS